MKNSVTDRDLVRQYLLGQIDEQAQVEEQLSERILFNDEMTDIVDSVEDEIIEEYLDQSLNSTDRTAVDTYFLRPPERREKLRFARLLRTHFEGRSSQYSGTQPARLTWPQVAWGSQFRSYGQLLAVLLILVAGLIYAVGMRRSQARLQAELSQQQELSASLKQQAELLQPAMVSLTLLADRSRGAGASIPTLQIKSSTRRIVVDIALQGETSAPYDVRLERRAGTEGPLWSARLLPIVSPDGGARLVFDLPTGNLLSGMYSFAVSSTSPDATGTRLYDFQIKMIR